MTFYNTLTRSALDQALLEDRSYYGENLNAFEFPAFKVGAFLSDGSVVLADSTNSALQRIVGLSQAAIPSGHRGLFVQRGIVPGAITDLGALAGDPIYLGVVAGSLVLTAPTTKILIGYASENPNTGLVTDLRLSFDSGTSVASPTSTAPQTMSLLNGEGVTTPASRVVCWNNDSTVLLANAAVSAKSDSFGITTEAIAPDSFGAVQYTGPVENACTGLGAVAGQPVFLSSTVSGGLTLVAPTDPAHSVVRIGYAIPRSGTNGAANDLMLDTQVLFLP